MVLAHTLTPFIAIDKRTLPNYHVAFGVPIIPFTAIFTTTTITFDIHGPLYNIFFCLTFPIAQVSLELSF